MAERDAKMRTATEMSYRPDLRLQQANVLAAAVMDELYREIDRVHPDELRHRIMGLVCDAMVKVMHDEGVEVMTDYTRQAYGLPPRGPDGWTLEEIEAMERIRLDTLLKPLTFTLPFAEPGSPEHDARRAALREKK